MKLRMIFALTVLLALSACGRQDAPAEEHRTYHGIDISEPLTLTMYLMGERTRDFDAVYERVNDLLSEKVNATLDIQFVPSDGKKSSYERLFLTGEEFDLVFTASGWGYYESMAGMGGFYELTPEFVETYAPDIAGLLPEEAWKQANINGAVYMIPGYTREYGLDVVGVRGDLMEKYGYTDISTPEELEAFLRDVAAGEAYITPMGTRSGAGLPSFFLYPGMHDVSATPYAFFVYNMGDCTDSSILYTVDTPEFLVFARKMKEFKDLNFWSSDTLSSTDTRADSWMQGSAAIMVWNISAVSGFARQINAAHPEWKATFVDVTRSTPKQINAYINNGMAINSQSRHPERSMMVLNELMTDPQIHDLTTLGIEGVHWKAADENRYRSLEASSGYPPFRTCCWGWSNQEIERTEYVEDSDPVYLKLQETLAAWDSNPVCQVHPYAAFSFNSDPVAEIQQRVEAVCSQYYLPIAAGLVDDPEAAVEDLRQRLTEAGIYELYDEIQKQAAEFWRSAAR